MYEYQIDMYENVRKYDFVSIVVWSMLRAKYELM